MTIISREYLKLAIDTVDDTQLEILHRIILALKEPISAANLTFLNTNPLKGSVIFEDDIISPIDESWEVDQ